MDQNQSLFLQIALAQQQILHHDALVKNGINLQNQVPSLAAVNVAQQRPIPNPLPVVQVNGINIDHAGEVKQPLPVQQFFFTPLQQPNLKRNISLASEEITPPKRVQSVAPTMLLPKDNHSGSASVPSSPTPIQFVNLIGAPKLQPIANDSNTETSFPNAMPKLTPFDATPGFQPATNEVQPPKPLITSTLPTIETHEGLKTTEEAFQMLENNRRISDGGIKLGMKSAINDLTIIGRLHPIVAGTIEDAITYCRTQREKFEAQLDEKDANMAKLFEEMSRMKEELELKEKQLKEMEAQMNEKSMETALLRGDAIRYKSMLTVAFRQNNPESNPVGLVSATGEVLSLGRS